MTGHDERLDFGRAALIAELDEAIAQRDEALAKLSTEVAIRGADMLRRLLFTKDEPK